MIAAVPVYLFIFYSPPSKIPLTSKGGGTCSKRTSYVIFFFFLPPHPFPVESSLKFITQSDTFTADRGKIKTAGWLPFLSTTAAAADVIERRWQWGRANEKKYRFVENREKKQSFPASWSQLLLPWRRRHFSEALLSLSWLIRFSSIVTKKTHLASNNKISLSQQSRVSVCTVNTCSTHWLNQVSAVPRDGFLQLNALSRLNHFKWMYCRSHVNE